MPLSHHGSPVAALAPVRITLLFCLLSSLACGSDSSGPPDDPDAAGGGGGTADASSASSGNALGQTCADNGACPSDPPHQCVFLESGDPELGYCSPICSGDDDCQSGFEGPGDPVCFVPNVPDACTIQCDGPGGCPEGLVCVEPGGPVNFCATPQP